jgi:hypothetical protein
MLPRAVMSELGISQLTVKEHLPQAEPVLRDVRRHPAESWLCLGDPPPDAHCWRELGVRLALTRSIYKTKNLPQMRRR